MTKSKVLAWRVRSEFYAGTLKGPLFEQLMEEYESQVQMNLDMDRKVHDWVKGIEDACRNQSKVFIPREEEEWDYMQDSRGIG